MQVFSWRWTSFSTTSTVSSLHTLFLHASDDPKDTQDPKTSASSSHNHPLQPGHIALLRRNLKVPVDNAAIQSTQVFRYLSAKQVRNSTHVTASSIPVPEPRAPIRSLATDKAPMQAPPNAAAVGMILLSSLYMLCSRWPAMTSPCSLSCFATSRGAEPLTSIQVFENPAHAVTMNTT